MQMLKVVSATVKSCWFDIKLTYAAAIITKRNFVKQISNRSWFTERTVGLAKNWFHKSTITSAWNLNKTVVSWGSFDYELALWPLALDAALYSLCQKRSALDKSCQMLFVNTARLT